MGRSRVTLAYCVIAAWMVWLLAASVMLMRANADAAFMGLYLTYLLASAVVLYAGRKDLLAPAPLVTLAGFLAFGLNLPLIYVGNRSFETSDVTTLVITDAALLKVLTIFLVAKAAFILGSSVNVRRLVPADLSASSAPQTRRVSVLAYLLVTAIVVVAGGLRIKFHLGEAGVQPNIPYAGAWQYILFDGVLLLCSWYVAQGLRQGRVQVLLGLSLLLMLAFTQALLSWRGGIAQIGSVAFGLFWYQSPGATNRQFSLGWLILLPLLASTIIQFGNETRSARLGGEKVFATSTTELIGKLAYRSQGTTRLAAVADYVGPLTIFNHFFIWELRRQGLSTTTYIDRRLYAVGDTQSHSVGTSGPGGPYLAMGLAGVAAAYLLLGIFYRHIHAHAVQATATGTNLLSVMLYSYLIYTLLNLLSENFNLAFLKNMLAVFIALALLKRFIRQRRRA